MMEHESRIPLDPLDPGSREPGYWNRLRRQILSAAAPELARRRARAEIGVSDVMFAWSRAVVPTALAAAMAAVALLVVEFPAEAERYVGIEEMLEVEEEPMPALLAAERESAFGNLSVSFISEEF